MDLSGGLQDQVTRDCVHSRQLCIVPLQYSVVKTLQQMSVDLALLDLSGGLQSPQCQVTRVRLKTAVHCTSTIFSSQDITDVSRPGSLRVGLNPSCLYDILE